jgi:hypothetical protein
MAVADLADERAHHEPQNARRTHAGAGTDMPPQAARISQRCIPAVRRESRQRFPFVPWAMPPRREEPRTRDPADPGRCGRCAAARSRAAYAPCAFRAAGPRPEAVQPFVHATRCHESGG